MTVGLPMFDPAAEQLLAEQAGLLGESVEMYVSRAVAFRLLAQLERQDDVRQEHYRSAFASTGLLPEAPTGTARPPVDGALVLGGAKDDALQSIIDLATEALGVPAGIATVADRDWHLYRSSHGSNTTGDRSPDRHQAQASARHIMRTGRPLIVADTHIDPGLREHPDVLGGTLRAFLGFPIARDDGHTVGAFCVADREVRYWTRAHVEILEYYAQQIADYLFRAAER